MIVAQNITKYFGGFRALRNISFEIGSGEIIGFLGPNGAGKTTIMRILTSYLPVTSGRVLISGKDVAKNSLAIRKKIGYLPETPPLYPNMTTKEYLRFAAQMKDVPAKRRRFQIDKVLEECHLKEVQDKSLGVLSKGYKQRVGIAQAIINEPEVLILDEPTNGLDPIQILQVRNLIKSLEERRTVIISTHILSEIQQIAQRVLVIQSGEIIADESLKNLLRGKENQQKISVRVKGERKGIEKAIKEINFLKQINIDTVNNVHSIELEIAANMEHYNELVNKLLGSAAQILEIKEIKPDLEEVFLRLTSKKSVLR